MSIADQITRIKNAKAAIKTAIQNKGVAVSDKAKIDEYAALIDNISVSSGDEEPSIWPYFWELRTKNNTDFSYLFHGVKATNSDEDKEILNKIENLDVSNVTAFNYTFNIFGSSNDKIQELNLTKWDIGKGRDFSYFLGSAYPLKINMSGLGFGTRESSYSTNINYLFNNGQMEYIDMSNCTLNSKTTSISSLFSYCSKLVTLDITGCDFFSRITSISSMFQNCSKLTTVIGEIDLSNLNSGFYSASYADPLKNCSSLETLYLKNIYKNVTTMKNEAKWCIDMGVTKIKDECLIYIINELPDLINDKGLTATDKIILTLPKTNTLTAEQVQPAIDKGWTVANTTY